MEIVRTLLTKGAAVIPKAGTAHGLDVRLQSRFTGRSPSCCFKGWRSWMRAGGRMDRADLSAVEGRDASMNVRFGWRDDRRGRFSSVSALIHQPPTMTEEDS